MNVYPAMMQTEAIKKYFKIYPRIYLKYQTESFGNNEINNSTFSWSMTLPFYFLDICVLYLIRVIPQQISQSKKSCSDHGFSVVIQWEPK